MPQTHDSANDCLILPHNNIYFVYGWKQMVDSLKKYICFLLIIPCQALEMLVLCHFWPRHNSNNICRPCSLRKKSFYINHVIPGLDHFGDSAIIWTFFEEDIIGI